MDFELIIESTALAEWVLLGLFFVTLVIQCIYYLGIYIRLPLFKPKKQQPEKKGISVVICAKNEADNLERFLPLILEQEYPEFEVVVVNDCSTDHTEALLSGMKVGHKNLRYTNIPVNDKFIHGKKLALTIGMKSARYDHVLLTDADCYPADKMWLQSMTSKLEGEKDIVLGYGRYERRKGLLNTIIRYETAFTALQYFSFALKGKPYMGVGRNLAYRKELFFKNKGFSSHYHIASGDDDLFVNQNAVRSNTCIEIEAESHTISMPKDTIRAWIRQKRRHLAAGTFYNKKSRFSLGTELVSRILLYSTYVITSLATSWLWPATILFGLFLLIRMSIFKLGMKRLNEKYLLLPSFLLDPVLPLILGLIWITNFFVPKKQSWS